MKNIEDYINNLKRKINFKEKEILFVCIGTNKVLADSIGPLVGSYLKTKIEKNKVLGDMNNNICSKKDLICYYPKLRNKFIIAVDSAISKQRLEGEIFISNSPIIMGLGVNKNKGAIGNVSIKAVVSNLEMNDKEYVNSIAEFIGDIIYYSVTSYNS